MITYNTDGWHTQSCSVHYEHLVGYGCQISEAEQAVPELVKDEPTAKVTVDPGSGQDYNSVMRRAFWNKASQG